MKGPRCLMRMDAEQLEEECVKLSYHVNCSLGLGMISKLFEEYQMAPNSRTHQSGSEGDERRTGTEGRGAERRCGRKGREESGKAVWKEGRKGEWERGVWKKGGEKSGKKVWKEDSEGRGEESGKEVCGRKRGEESGKEVMRRLKKGGKLNRNLDRNFKGVYTRRNERNESDKEDEEEGSKG
uniref:Uncharacterized protein n=1 Tax=Chromera velia CCMP2878 TaxID=1169474 RepID=A0A0G4FDH9_9ALVE|eukprot:Cvel_16481.t1-p1 / transcript=Cvel_16481.t1 / gene=Cvel_16481 / organism=Chromera_velia_CCMP2878 / gene_product=hypothetical protein / transcript_product=hypothetical protein / location=Cvel_scaffold1270:39563-41370(-) / protein_length=181 / sequence_SO=supercontig / SO=protein_coding / is_pseudo=false